MYTSIQIGKAVNKAVLHRKFCSDLYAENLVDLRAMILHLGGHFKYVFDRATGELWPKSYVCKQLRKGVSAGQWLAMLNELNLTIITHADTILKNKLIEDKYQKTLEGMSEAEGLLGQMDVKTRAEFKAALRKDAREDVEERFAKLKMMNPIVNTALKTLDAGKLLTTGAAGTGVGIATYRALKLLEGPALRQIQKKQAADEKKMSKVPKTLKPLPKHKHINDLRRQLYKKRGFKPIWFIQPNGEARGIQQIHRAYSIYS